MRTTSFWKAANHEGVVVTNLMKLLYSVVRLDTKVLICGDHSQQFSKLVLLGSLGVCNSFSYLGLHSSSSGVARFTGLHHGDVQL